MKICLNCKYLSDNDLLQSCPKCNGDLALIENYDKQLRSEEPSDSMYLSKQDRMYEDIHTIKNILVAFITFFIISIVLTLIMFLG